ncbi:hypothetical protein PIROE2DRAFT_1802 [Piromyces sp. E2]|nr:hypothetical protein PIROE2DRAFT_1802 [Piromyces sp. E2]|eukprot:OUM70120.1 hypothetical protein PIROE2DRAFT_1802 [Piromyces sp. E2]
MLKITVPVIAEMCPKDTLEIFKSGNCFRINTSVVGVVTSGIPRVIKGKHSLVAKFDNEKGTCKSYVMDLIAKKYQEFYPDLPPYIIDNLTNQHLNTSSIYKFLLDFTTLSVKQKKGNILKKGKKTLHIERGKTYKADVFKIKGIKTNIRKRCKESVIGPYKSDIKTNIIKVDSLKRTNSTVSNASSGSDDNLQNLIHKVGDDILKKSKSIKGSSKQKYYKNDDDDDDDDDDESDSDISDNELSEKPGKEKEEEEKERPSNSSILEKYILPADPNEFDPKIDSHLSDMIIRGYDDNNNVITKQDVEYIRNKYPKYLQKMFHSKMDSRFIALEKLHSTNENSNITKNVSNDGKTVVYEVQDSDDSNLNWDEIYDLKHPDGEEEEEKIHSQSQKKMNSKRMKDFDWEKNKLNEDDYFDPSNTENLHVGRIFDINEENKSINNHIKVWMTRENEFPITFEHIKPLMSYFYFLMFEQLNVIGSNNNSQTEKLKESFSILQTNKRYPIKLEIPILPVLKFQLKTIECNLDPKVIPEGIFDVPADFEPGRVGLEKK